MSTRNSFLVSWLSETYLIKSFNGFSRGSFSGFFRNSSKGFLRNSSDVPSWNCSKISQRMPLKRNSFKFKNFYFFLDSLRYSCCLFLNISKNFLWNSGEDYYGYFFQVVFRNFPRDSSNIFGILFLGFLQILLFIFIFLWMFPAGIPAEIQTYIFSRSSSGYSSMCLLINSFRISSKDASRSLLPDWVQLRKFLHFFS